MTVWRVVAWVLFTSAFVSMCLIIAGLFPPFRFYEYLPITLGGLGVAAILIHDDRKGNFRG